MVESQGAMLSIMYYKLLLVTHSFISPTLFDIVLRVIKLYPKEDVQSLMSSNPVAYVVCLQVPKTITPS